MKKIVILGCENSHANTFLDFISRNPEFSDIEIIGVYSEDTEAAQKLNEKYGVPVMENCDSAVGKVDGIIVTARHGDKHYEFAKPYIASGVPMFIDKPITINEAEAVEFMRELKAQSIPVTGGSSLRYNYVVGLVKDACLRNIAGPTVGGTVRAPLYPTSPHGGFYFYAQHLVEMVIEAFGHFPISVQASEDAGKNLTVLFNYDNFTVTGLYTNGGNEYYAARFSRNGTQGGPAATHTNEPQIAEFRDFVKILNGGDMSMSYDDFIAPVFIMNAIERSRISGAKEKILYCEV